MLSILISLWLWLLLFDQASIHLQVWYAIAPGASRKRFEDFARTLYPNDAKNCSNFLRHKNVMITPKLIRDEGIPIITVRPFRLFVSVVLCK